MSRKPKVVRKFLGSVKLGYKKTFLNVLSFLPLRRKEFNSFIYQLILKKNEAENLFEKDVWANGNFFQNDCQKSTSTKVYSCKPDYFANYAPAMKSLCKLTEDALRDFVIEKIEYDGLNLLHCLTFVFSGNLRSPP